MWKSYGKLFKAQENRKKQLSEKLEDVRNHNKYVKMLSESKKASREQREAEIALEVEKIEAMKVSTVAAVEQHFEKLKEEAKSKYKSNVYNYPRPESVSKD